MSSDHEPSAESPERRLLSLDAYRGLIMISLAFNGFGLAKTAENHLKLNPDSTFWEAIRYQFSHVEWQGCGYWDLIQPSFMFMVGVSMAYSYANRQAKQHSLARLFGHAVVRSILLILLGIFLISNGRETTNWSLMNVLTQIGLGYPLLFLLWNRRIWIQCTALVAILCGTWALYHWYPSPGIDLEMGNSAVGVKPEWARQYLHGVPPQWHKNANIGHRVDLVLLNWLPQSSPFEFNSGGYQTINFIPSLATMLMGLICGELLRSRVGPIAKIAWLLVGGLWGILIGYGLDRAGVCPLVKRIWTPSWALFSTGYCCWILAVLYAICDVAQFRRWAMPLVVVGVNSIAIYCMGQLLPGWTAQTIKTHFGPHAFTWLGDNYEPLVRTCLVGSMFWLACLWMYRQRIQIRI